MFLLDAAVERPMPTTLRTSDREVLFHGSLESSRASVIFDVDSDGDLGIVTNEMNDDRPMVLISNEGEQKRINFLQVKLVGSASNRDGLGATVKVKAGNLAITRFSDGKSGYLGQSVLPLNFGLGGVRGEASVEIHLASREKQLISKESLTMACSRCGSSGSDTE